MNAASIPPRESPPASGPASRLTTPISPKPSVETSTVASRPRRTCAKRSLARSPTTSPGSNRTERLQHQRRRRRVGALDQLARTQGSAGCGAELGRCRPGPLSGMGSDQRRAQIRSGTAHRLRVLGHQLLTPHARSCWSRGQSHRCSPAL